MARPPDPTRGAVTPEAQTGQVPAASRWDCGTRSGLAQTGQAKSSMGSPSSRAADRERLAAAVSASPSGTASAAMMVVHGFK